MPDLKAMRQEFLGQFSSEPRFFRAPGRVNLIGEHTDYNAGLVMPAAIQFYTTIAIGPRADRRLRIRSAHFGETREVDLSESKHWDTHRGERVEWIDYVVGVALALEQLGVRLAGANLLIHSDVPLGAGLSSSAALEVATALALSSLAGHAIGPLELATIGQQAENEYVGMRCGIMDQFAAAFGRAGHAIKLDCRSLEHEYLSLVGHNAPAGAAGQLVICDTQVRHRHAGGEFNRRRQECELGVAALKRLEPRVQALRDLSPALLQAHELDVEPVIYRRCRHVVNENARVSAGAAALKDGDLVRFGELMRQSHVSLRDDYEVSCGELDVMVRLAEQIDGVYGARMTGGGFGGCTVNLVRAEAVGKFMALMTAGYTEATGRAPEIYVCEAAEGAGEVPLEGVGNRQRGSGGRGGGA